jgi:hypothetical protein
MKNINLLKWSVLSFASVGILSAEAQITSPPQPERNRIGASFRAAFNANVNFLGVGAFAPVAPTRLTPDGAPFNYDNGYVLTDDTGNVMGVTRYWGYDSATQKTVDGTILMHSTSSAGISTRGTEDDPRLGFELTYSRELGRGKHLRWGVESAFNYMNVCVQDSRPLSIAATRVTTPYQLPPLEGGGFVDPPTPYYHGTALTPGLHNDVITAMSNPSSTDPAFAATMTGARNFDADVLGFRLGPYLELPLGERWLLAFSGGLALAQVNSDFSFNEAVALPNVPPVSGAGSHDDLLVGWYVAGNVNFQLTKAWGLFGGVQFQDVGKYSHTVNGRTAVLDLSATIFIVAGASFSF